MIARENNNKKILSTIVNLEPPLHKAVLEKNIKTKKFAFFICFLLSFLEKKNIEECRTDTEKGRGDINEDDTMQ